MKRFKRNSVKAEFSQNETGHNSRVKIEQLEQITIEDTGHNHNHDHGHNHKNNSIIVLLSLSAHSFFDGLLLGMQKTEKDMWQFLVFYNF